MASAAAADLVSGALSVAARGAGSGGGSGVESASPLPSLLVGFATGLLLVVLLETASLYSFWIKPRLAKLYPRKIRPKQTMKTLMEWHRIQLLDESTPSETCKWVNAVVAYLWVDFWQSAALVETLKLKIDESLFDARRSPAGVFLNSLRVRHLHLGSSPPIARNITVLPQKTGQLDITLLADVHSENGMSGTIDVELAFGVTATAYFAIKCADARLYLELHPSQAPPTIAFALLRQPQIDVDLRVVVGRHELPLLARLAKRFLVPVALRAEILLPILKTRWLGTPYLQPKYPWEVSDPDELYAFSPQPVPAHAASDG